MTRPTSITSNELTLHAALELSKNSWLLGVQFPDRDKPSLYPLKGGDANGLLCKLNAARSRVAKVTGHVAKLILCYEAGYDGFWLARLLEQNGVECKVMDPASLQIDRRARRVKTDRVDVEKLLQALIAWSRGERHVCSMVVIPSAEEEDLRRTHRERQRLVRAILIQSAWMWLRHQPDSALSQWFRKRTEGHARRVRCIMITALARKLAVALWRYLETGLIPEGATLTAK
jgi:transposase